jgi:hypothetical protein
MSASVQVQLPANTSIGPINASELATLDGLTATTAELNILHGATLSTAELNILTGTLVSALELNTLDGIGGNVQGQLNTKAFKAGDTYTGTHDFTLAELKAFTKGFADTSSSVATTEFVKNVMGVVPFINRNKAYFFGQL